MPWRCPGWNRTPSGAMNRPATNRPARRRCGWRFCFREMDSTPGNGGRKEKGRGWSWARCSLPCMSSARSCCLSAGCIMRRRGRGISTARRPGICCQAPRLPRAARSGQAQVLIRCLPRPTDAPPRCRVWCWAASGRIHRCTRTTRCSTAPTFHGVRRPPPRRWNCIRRWPSTGSSRMRSRPGTRACWMR